MQFNGVRAILSRATDDKENFLRLMSINLEAFRACLS